VGTSSKQTGTEELTASSTPEGKLLEQDIAAMERLGVHARAVVRYGLVVDEILRKAQAGTMTWWSSVPIAVRGGSASCSTTWLTRS
jgi:hypothetical protein